MSYCRWSECDVYAYDSGEGVRFHVAGDQSLDRLCGTYNEAYQYAKELHDVHKLDVPKHALHALMEDAIEEARRFTGPNSAISELTAENARLRQELAIREASEQEKVIEYLGKECVDWEDKYRALAKDNAVLRHVALDAYQYLYGLIYKSYTFVPERVQGIADSLRRLGVEVPDE